MSEIIKIGSTLERAYALLQKNRSLPEPEQRQRLIAFLMKRGYSRAAAGHRAGQWGLKG